MTPRQAEVVSFRAGDGVPEAPSPAGVGRPQGIPLPPHGRMPLVRDGRALKRWRYVGVFGSAAMLCAGDAHVGPSRQTFWAVWDRQRRVLREGTRWLRHGHVQLRPGVMRIHDRDVDVELVLEEQAGVEVVCPHGEGYVWTRKQGGVRAYGTITLAGRREHVRGSAVIDDTAGYHSRHTAWCWSAGVGQIEDGTPVAWNLVEGVNDPPRRSERTVWIGDVAREAPSVTFDRALDHVRCQDGSELRFAAEAERARRDNLLLLRSDYRQPFGSFSGSLPGGERLARGLGVMERHEARW